MKKTNRRSKQSSPIDASASTANESQRYEERIRELERENKAYQMEIAQLREKQGDSSASDNGVEKLRKDYLQKLNFLEEQVTELKKKLDSQSQFSTQRKRVDEATKQSQFEIQSLKAQKVQLHCKIKLESVQFRLCKALLEKEILQLKKEGRRNEFKIHSLLASNQRLKMVLQRKTEEASAATKRLREMIEARKVISNRSAGARNGNARVIQDAQHELEVTAQLHKLCSDYESQMEKMAEEIAKLKEAEMQREENLKSPLQEEDSNCLENDFDIQDLKQQLKGLGCLVRELQLRKEKLDSKDKKQDLVQPLLSDESDNKLLIKMDTPEMNSSSENKVKGERAAEGLCCSCSKKSLCKTTKCRCRSAGGSCGPSCGCTRFKCTNREPNLTSGGHEPLKSENSTESIKSTSASEDGSVIASEGAKLLQSAHVQKPASCRDNPGTVKKPLCNIQNSLGKLDAQKPVKKKKGRKPVIQLVTKDPLSSPPENNSSSEAAAASVDSNSGHPNELATAVGNVTGVRNLRNPTRQAKALIGKENCFV